MVFRKKEQVCLHEWVTVSDVILKSAFEDFLEKGDVRSQIRFNQYCFEKVHIVVLKCIACGKIEKIETRSGVPAIFPNTGL